jgi:hypothetical protein
MFDDDAIQITFYIVEYVVVNDIKKSIELITELGQMENDTVESDCLHIQFLSLRWSMRVGNYRNMPSS